MSSQSLNQNNIELIDTHCHIQSTGHVKGERATRELWAKAPDMQPDDIIVRAYEQGVTKLICVGCDLEDSKLSVDFVRERENCVASIGIHPHEAQHYAGDEKLKHEFAALVGEQKVVAIGECGLDFYYTHSPKDAQIEILRFQIELALKHDLPLIFHVREAFNDFWPIFESYKGIRGVVHSFTDSVENLKRAITHGLYIGVNGIATFAPGEQKNVMYRTIPQHLLLLETDAPFLTPVPHRGKVNESKHIRTIAEYLAQLRGESLQSLATATTQNAKKLFKL